MLSSWGTPYLTPGGSAQRGRSSLEGGSGITLSRDGGGGALGFYAEAAILVSQIIVLFCSDQCIVETKVCDGVQDCRDGADESEEELGIFQLPKV